MQPTPVGIEHDRRLLGSARTTSRTLLDLERRMVLSLQGSDLLTKDEGKDGEKSGKSALELHRCSEGDRKER